MNRLRSWGAIAVVLAFVFTACGGDDTTAGTTTAPPTTGAGATTTSAVALTDSFRGVTATSIKLGIVMIDYDCIAQFIDFNRGNQQAIAQSFVDDINNNGGVLGRTVEPVFKTYCPIDNTDALALCTSLTEDEQVFAVLGVFIDDSGDAQLCLTRDHETIHIGHEFKQEWIDQAPPGLLLTPDITAERREQVLFNVLKSEGTLDGKTVAILGDQETQTSVDSVIKPALDAAGLAQGSTAILTIEGEDTTAAQAQLDSFIEKWRGEGVNALVMSGLNVSAKQFVEKIRAAFPDLTLVTDAPSGTLAAAQDEVTAGVSPNPYEGMLTAEGLTSSERWKTDRTQQCVKVYADASGQPVVGPDELLPGADGKRAEVYIAVEDFCNELDMFKQIAEKAGADLTNDSWTQAVEGFGAIQLVSTDIASLGPGKYDADDGFRLESFDSTIGDKGDWNPLTELVDASS